MTDICLIFEVHQPLRLNRNFHADLLSRPHITKKDLFELYFDNNLNRYVLERAAKKCYFPANEILLEQIDRFRGEKRKFKVAFGISGVFIEQCERWLPSLLDSFKELFETGCVEFLDEPYYHSLASLYGIDRSEFVEQVLMHKQLMRSLFNYEPKVFENTECLYNNAIAKTVEGLGYKAILTEGVDRILKWRSPNYVYKAKNCNLKVLLRNYRLSDDIGFRFSSRWWNQWPLFADKYASWLAKTPGQVIVIFMDYETFGEHHWPESGIHEFLRHLPEEVLKWRHLNWCTPSEVVDKHVPVGEIDVFEYNTISWADLERDTSAWIGNSMQRSCYEMLKHLVFSRILSDFEARILQEFRRPELAAKWLLRRLPVGKGFTFFVEFARPTSWTVYSLEEFLKALKHVNLKSIKFHLERGDFERWLRHVIGDDKLADKFIAFSKKRFKDKELRHILVSIVEARLNELKKAASSPKLSESTIQ